MKKSFLTEKKSSWTPYLSSKINHNYKFKQMKTISSLSKLKAVAFLFVVSLFIQDVSAQSQGTFANPLLPSGADPYSFYKDGYYYYTHTTGNRLVLWKTKNIAELATAPKKTIWTPPVGTMYSKEIWAPEIHFIQGKWYISDFGKLIRDGKGKGEIKTVDGDVLVITWENSTFYFTDKNGRKAKLILSDAIQSNGILHGIDNIFSAK